MGFTILESEVLVYMRHMGLHSKEIKDTVETDYREADAHLNLMNYVKLTKDVHGVD